jgi:hypothetical protein
MNLRLVPPGRAGGAQVGGVCAPFFIGLVTPISNKMYDDGNRNEVS